MERDPVHYDIEDKWGVAPDTMSFTKEEIRALTYFQERYFKSTIKRI